MDDDLPPDLPRLRTLEKWAELYLERIRTRIAAVEQKAQPQRPTAEPAPPAAGPRRARTPDWGLTEAGIGTPATKIHRGDCWASGRTLVPISQERARAELASGTSACEVCRPDTVLARPLSRGLRRWAKGHPSGDDLDTLLSRMRRFPRGAAS
ncbi:DUF6233 domain-containing protein [Streptomyces sp. NPDC006863]|uniref:DUF6233 domain-containing protein n=1 Tax=Streptomyces sp. NPDC006863 TaxID=3154779 RepID=UPI0033C8DD16